MLSNDDVGLYFGGWKVTGVVEIEFEPFSQSCHCILPMDPIIDAMHSAWLENYVLRLASYQASLRFASSQRY